MRITELWIDDGCTCCTRCVSLVPRVFDVVDGSAVILGTMRSDGVTDPNPDRKPLRAGPDRELAREIIEAAEDCPVEVIRYRTMV